MKKNFRTIMVKGMAAFLCASAFIAYSCDKDKNNEKPADIAVTGVTLDKTTLSLAAGKTANLVATVAPKDATNKSITWASSAPTVATVADGKVTAVAEGTATVTVTTVDGGFKAECKVTVTAAGATVTGVTLDKTTLAHKVGETADLVATVTPEDAPDKSVTWASSATAVATVADGKVTAVAAGTATITVTTVVGGFTATCAVTVSDGGTTNPDLVFEDSFESGDLAGWTNLDQDGDNFKWKIGRGDVAPAMTVKDGVCCAYSESYDNVTEAKLTPDNWLISPAIELKDGQYILSFWVTGQDLSYFAEKYAVLVGTSATDVSTFTSIFEGTIETGQDYRNKTVDLSAYAGKTIHIAFRHYNITDMFCLDLDLVQVFAGNSVPSTASSPIPGPVRMNMAAKAAR